jgi:hypothetical protein
MPGLLCGWRRMRTEENGVLAANEEAADFAKHVGQRSFFVGHDLANGDRSVEQEHVGILARWRSVESKRTKTLLRAIVNA